MIHSHTVLYVLCVVVKLLCKQIKLQLKSNNMDFNLLFNLYSCRGMYPIFQMYSVHVTKFQLWKLIILSVYRVFRNRCKVVGVLFQKKNEVPQLKRS